MGNAWCGAWNEGGTGGAVLSARQVSLGGGKGVPRAATAAACPTPSSAEDDEWSPPGSGLPQTPPRLFGDSNDSALLAPVQMLELRRALPRSLRHCAWRKVFSMDRDCSSLASLSAKLADEQAVLLVLMINDGSLVGAVLAFATAAAAVAPAPAARAESCAHNGGEGCCEGADTGTAQAWPAALPAAFCASRESFLFSLPPSMSRRPGSARLPARKPDATPSPRRPTTPARRAYQQPAYVTPPATPVAPGTPASVGSAGPTERSVIPRANVFKAAPSHRVAVALSAGLLSIGAADASEQGLWLDGDLAAAGSGPCAAFNMPSSLAKDRMFDVLGIEAWVFSNATWQQQQQEPSLGRIPETADGAAIASW
jgi:hypothetical protein